MIEFLNHLHFANKEYLFTLLLLPILFLLPIRKNIADLIKYSNFAELRFLKLLQRSNKQTHKFLSFKILIILVTASLIASLAQLRGNHREIEVYSKQEKLVILIDLSLSMNVEDIYPSRLKYIKTELANALRKTDITAEIALVGFANIPYLLYPFTNDYETASNIIENLSTDIISIQGSNIESALSQASSLLEKFPVSRKNILLITDASYEIPDFSVIKKLAKEDLNLHIIAIGTEDGGPVIDQYGKFIQENNKNVVSKLNTRKLSDLKTSLNATIHIVSNHDFEIGLILNNIFDANTNNDDGNGKIKIWEEYSYIVILLAMLFMLPFFRKGFLIISILYLAIPQQKAHANVFLNKDQQAMHLYEKKQYSEAEDLFRDDYNKGVAAYRNQDYKNASKYFSKNKHDEQSLFNLGNSNLLQGKIQEAISNYESLLKNNGENKKAQKNLEIAKKLLEQQQNQQQENQEQQEQQENQTQQQDSNDNQDNSEKNNNQENPDNKEQNDNQQQSEQQKTDGNNKEDKQAEQTIEDNILNMIDAGTDKMLENKVKQQDDKNAHKLKQTKPW